MSCGFSKVISCHCVMGARLHQCLSVHFISTAFSLPAMSPTLDPLSIPVNVHDGGCVSMATGFATGLWEVRECVSSKAKFICRQRQETAASPEPPAPQPTPSLSGSCPNGWKSNSNLRYCYKVHPLCETRWGMTRALLSFTSPSRVQVFHSSQLEQKLSWLQAHLFCQRHGANLLSIGSPEEEHFVLQVLHEAFGWVRTAHRVIFCDVMMMVMMEMMIWPTGSQKSTSSTGFG